MDSENYICILGQKIELAAEQIKQLKDALRSKEPRCRLSERNPGETFKLGEYEFVVLDKCCGLTSAILKEPAFNAKFGSNNNFDGSNVDSLCQDFADKLEKLIGKENLVEHLVNLLSDDGLDDYGEITRRVSLLATDRYRQYVKILDEHKPNKWWWLATPHSTATHENDEWGKCVSPRGFIFNYHCGSVNFGVRPFCIFKSSIFVS